MEGIPEVGCYSRTASLATEYHSTCSDLGDHTLDADDHSTLSSSNSNLGSTLESTSDISSHNARIALGLVNTEAQERNSRRIRVSRNDIGSGQYLHNGSQNDGLANQLPVHATTLSHKVVVVMLSIAVFNSIIAVAMVLVTRLLPKPQPRFALIPMVLSIVALICTTGDLIYRARAKRVTWRRHSRICVYWFFHPSPADDQPFGTLLDAVSFPSAVADLVLASMAYYYSFKHERNPIGVAPEIVILAIAQLGYTCSVVWKLKHNNAQRINLAE